MAASIVTIFLFFIYTLGLGWTATYLLRKKGITLENSILERAFVNIGIGLGIFSILSIFLNFLHLPLDWRVFLVLSLVLPIYVCIKEKKYLKNSYLHILSSPPSFKVTKSTLAILLVLAISLLSLYMYTKGAFSYPYLEDEDPWGHAVGAKYVALEKTAYDPPLQNTEREIDSVLSYIDPYPPAYDIMMGVLHQTSANLTWTLKFFNALIISLGFIFFYLFAKQFIGNNSKALFATFILAVVPSYLSHFIWAHSLVITLFFPTMYVFEKMRTEKQWWPLAVLLVASIWVSQNIDQPLKLSTMIVLYIVVISVTQRHFFVRHATALIGGFLVSLVWWGTMLKKYGLQGFASFYNVGTSYAAGTDAHVAVARKFNLASIIKSLVSPGGSGSRAYTFNDFFVAQKNNMINNPIGIGVVLSLLVLLGVIFLLWKYRSSLVQQENTWRCVALFWLIFAFWGVNGQTFPVSVARGPFRVWMLLAIPVALLAAEGFSFLKSFFSKSQLLKGFVIVGVILGLLVTSGYQKSTANTAIWPTSGSFVAPQEAFQYGQWFASLPDNTPVFLYSPRDKLTLGFGAFSCLWCQEVIDVRTGILQKEIPDLHSFLKKNEYQYLVINGRMDAKYLAKTENETTLLQQRYDELLSSGLFTPAHQVEGSFVALKVN